MIIIFFGTCKLVGIILIIYSVIGTLRLSEATDETKHLQKKLNHVYKEMKIDTIMEFAGGFYRSMSVN